MDRLKIPLTKSRISQNTSALTAHCGGISLILEDAELKKQDLTRKHLLDSIRPSGMFTVPSI